MGYQLGGFWTKFYGGLKIRADALTQPVGFTDVERVAGNVFEDIYSRR